MLLKKGSHYFSVLFVCLAQDQASANRYYGIVIKSRDIRLTQNGIATNPLLVAMPQFPFRGYLAHFILFLTDSVSPLKKTIIAKKAFEN
jgi:hypothetical protein